MLETAIDQFFVERKEGWLKKKINAGMNEQEIYTIENECESVFSLDRWLPNAAKRAGKMSISTHPCTFSHPSARKNKNGYTTSVICEGELAADGLLRTGNAQVDQDALGSAASLDVYKFLSIVTENGMTVQDHILKDSELAKNLLNIPSADYLELKSGFMALMSSDTTMVTSSKLKQIYFPVNKSYHLLSVLSNSGMIFELRNRIDLMRFGERVKEGRRKRRSNEYSGVGYSEISNICTMAYGGTKPQNISVLNNKNGGKAHLLMSCPPVLIKRTLRFPTRNFFIQGIGYYSCREALECLDRIFKVDKGGNIPLDKIRKAIERNLADLLDSIVVRMTALRACSEHQYREESNNLPGYQKIWLCNQYRDERRAQSDWLDTLCEEISRWINAAYNKVVKQPVLLGKAERLYLNEFIQANKEVLR